MDSPSAQLVDSDPSSPFISEVESRAASKQWNPPVDNRLEEEQTQDVFMTPHKPLIDHGEDKENVQQSRDDTTQKALVPPKTTTPQSVHNQDSSPLKDRTESESNRTEMAPPQSARKTPRRSPLKPAHNAAATPSSTRRSDPFRSLNLTHGEPGIVPSSKPEPRTPPQDLTSVDDTCFSTFSEIPDMTLFAKLGQSTAKRGDTMRTPGWQVEATPRTSRKRPSPSRSPSPTPRRAKTPAHTSNDNTTNFLIDFTQQMESISSHRSSSPSKSSTQHNLLDYINSQRSPNKSARQSFATPAKSNSILNLLDFELPPAPTPRSIPTITVRELESLKSSYLSQISSLKATLSGREAEVESLKRAIVDAERRAGEAQEGLREEKCRRENVEEEKAQWERRGQEVENVLKNVREEALKGEAEKEDLLRRIEDSERRADEVEERATKAEERYADALAARASAGESGGANVEEQVQQLVAAQIDAKIEAVSRELHSVYKEKHERKVATLKKSYEARSEKKCAELQTRLTELERQNEDLQAARDATFSGPVPDTSMVASNNDADLKAQLEEQKALLAGLENSLRTSRKQQDQLRHELERERVEKGDLVAAVDEMLALQQTDQGPAQAAMSVVEDFRKSISRPSGLRAPAPAGESRIGRGGPVGLGRSVSSGLGKSKMLANIERMGRTASAGAPAE